MIPETHYQHSGKAPLSGILTTLVGGLVAGLAWGAIYGFLIYWSPFVYINAFITLGCGILLGVHSVSGYHPSRLTPRQPEPSGKKQT